METETNKRKRLIRRLLTEQLLPEEKQNLIERSSVENEMKKQWNQFANDPVKTGIKRRIWMKIQRRCEGKSGTLVHIELWHSLAAAVAIFLVIGGLLFLFGDDEIEVEKSIKIIAENNQLYVLPDSTKVWMKKGSSIQYSKAFNKRRNVWLSGNSLFEVTAQNGHPFHVYIQKAMIEVKGTCFDIKQNSEMKRNEITLYSGKINYNPEDNEKIEMNPHQKIIHNVERGKIYKEDIGSIYWENGRFCLKELTLFQLIETINKMYDSHIQLKVNEKEIKSAFTGYIRYEESLEEVLQKICYSLSLNVQKQENNFIIYK